MRPPKIMGKMTSRPTNSTGSAPAPLFAVAVVFAVAAFAIAAIALQFRAVREADRLKSQIAEDRALAARARQRAASLTKMISELKGDLAKIQNLPISLAATSDELRSAIEHSALTAGISFAVEDFSADAAYKAEKDDNRLDLTLSFHADEASSRTFVRAILARREFFLIKGVSWRRLDDSFLDVQLNLTAFTKSELSK